jgi:CheY-like chemotaxis protein
LGIGLTLVRYLVEMHGGSVEARSEGAGRGSEFTVRIPAIAHAIPDAPTDNSSDGESDAARRILIVDDNIDAADSLAILLRFRGNHVELAYDGHSAIDSAKRVRPDIVLLDIGLPGMDGYEVVRLLRSDRDFASTLIVAVTGYGQDEDRQLALAAGFNCHLTKPVNIIELNRMLQSLSHSQHNGGDSRSVARSLRRDDADKTFIPQ